MLIATIKDEVGSIVARGRVLSSRMSPMEVGKLLTYEVEFIYDGADVDAIPKRILQSGNRTIVFWADGTKTIVKCADDEPDDPYNAFTAALAIKTYGSNSKVKRIIDKKLEVQYKDRTSGKMYIMENHETRKARRKYDKKKRKEQSHE